ncbi:TPA_asm: coat protein [ssRNA phage Gephyllon.1_10]|uniref:Coat protein n=2 Tax=Fiersviridae TaxID=2842319 RepID=A0A8S5L3R0_9VIRU|nr:coat protein [ssRNA phage Gephyllon.1_10]QDH89402.1 MAG: hypothetical protein H1BulkLitter4482_000002 [Leviviridae sp.]DAD52147.1 TPA_asm: coat protein [ssRNA phage Gephyllon.1_10]
MTTMASITVKKNDGVTDIVWTGVTASAGDKTPALWRSDTAVGTVGQKPVVTMSGQSNSNGDVRRINLDGSYPSVYTDSTTSLTSIRSKMRFTGSFAMPQDATASDINEFVAQITNLVASPLFKSSIQAGFAPV